MTRLVLLLSGSIAVAIGLGLSLSWETPAPQSPLVVFCAASNRAVMEAIAEDYRKEFDVPVEFQFGPSQTLLSSIETSGTGDLYLPADASYLESAASRGVTGLEFPLAKMQVVLGVAKGNPLNIHAFDDLLKESVRVVQANPEVAAVGKLTRDALTRQGKWDALNQHTSAFVSSVTEAANSVQAGAADVAVVYDAVVTTSPKLEAVLLPEFQETFADIRIGLIQTSGQQARAVHFAKYLSASDRGLKRYADFGFTPVQGEPWSGDSAP
ncbi:molybdate ABC transporter substrate-binding protein [Planctomicrobium sp. SH661]|uniref:molybdate ABC transporter substrate-binding protein n=1 Tax=Planctomicrobium sp. SH661 TaxID=3448124 RepID=UPI003F5B5F84